MRLDTLSVDLLQLAANYTYGASMEAANASSSVQVLSYDSRFVEIIGSNVSATLSDHKPWEFVHEAGLYLPSTKSIYAVSQSPSLSDPINITVIDPHTYTATASYTRPDLLMPNGGAVFNSTHILFCVFGSADVPSTLTLYNPSDNSTSILLSSFYGRRFSSINDARIKRDDGTVWFTDDYYGHYEGFGPAPVMPTQVYRFDPRNGDVRAVADRFDQPNGLEFSPDFKTLYVADSGYVHQPGNFNGTRSNSIYAFDVSEQGDLVNRRLFAAGPNAFVDGVHVDAHGNVWSTSGKGITAWNERGVMLGEIRVDADVNNFMFLPDGILLLALNNLWHIKCNVRPRSEEDWAI